MRAQVIAFLVVTILGSFAPQATVSADELVKFNSAVYVVGKLQQRLARERGEMPAGAPPTAIEGYLSKPDGSGPFPAVVYLHGCDGLSESERKGIAELMTSWGYVSLAVNSFATRGIKDACTQVMPALILARQSDALGALSYLSNLPFVDPQRIAITGASHGGIVALELASTHSVDLFAIPDGQKFKAAVAYYPLCSVATQTLSIPTLILIGELDDWTPSKNCEQWMASRAGKGAPVKLVIYPGAYHAFAAPALREGMRYFGHWIKYDADAAQRSVLEMHNFLATELAR
ncbi:dienelactone hydrolase family protein [Bradyrhizobium sp. SZCCHNS2005]|uniref:dienelactone hydrolase family protein n=1 Tax=Bradyrhizobium sp. SZCCHNS2005 TaxID=3057303 RepID=UPI0028E9B043|nr:dienelactone hydrolase family protein [Bradyrhizobium sp. SZCCHNS2005]